MLLIKAGGGKDINWEGVCRDIAEIWPSEPVILVHGASVQRDELAARLSVPVKKVVSPSGVMSVYTDQEAIEVFLMAYAGLVNKQVVARLQRHGVNAVGLCGVDGGLWRAKAKKEILVQEGEKTKLLKGNLTGRVEKVNAELLRLLLDHGYLPAVCAPALSDENEIVNTDNDAASAVTAGALGIKKMVFLFEAPGLLRDADDEGSLIRRIDRLKIEDALLFARGRMKKKILGVKRAIEAGVETVYFGDGRAVHPVKNALAGNGTVIS
jgi:[amino group carrier protein]-L-2-aminoadipate 6-kinase